MMDGKSQQPRLAELDALRGLAAVMVVLFHYTWHGADVLPELKMVPYGVAWGGYGVALFFAISGFVILMTLERTQNAADFLVSRFARLFPAYWFAVVFTSLGLIMLGATKLLLSPKNVLINLSMLQGFFYVPAVDGVYWSLTAELAFYACMLALWRIGWLRRIESVLLGWIALTFLWCAYPNMSTLVGGLLVVHFIPWFALGMAAYRVRSGERTWRQQLPLLLIALVSVGLTDGAADAVVFVLVVAIFAALISKRLTFLGHPILLWLGSISYPLYLLHQNLGYAFMAALQRSGMPVWATLVCTLAIALGVAHCAHVYIEQPSLRRIRGWWKNRRTAATA
jgi:peptidoglycan/LPS O-acetylase OafA/YrhL